MSSPVDRLAASGGADDDEVSLHGMRFHVLVGILPHEREQPQPLEVDVTAWKPAGGEVVDYRALYDIVSRVVGSGELDYLERIAERIADAALTSEPVRRVRVTVRKPHVSLPGDLDHAQVAVTRSRHA